MLKSLFDSTPLTTDDGVLLRRMALEIGSVHLVLACLSVLSHHAPRAPIPGFHQEVRMKVNIVYISLGGGWRATAVPCGTGRALVFTTGFRHGTTVLSCFVWKSYYYKA